MLDAKFAFLKLAVDGPIVAVHTPNQLDDRNTATIEIVNNPFSLAELRVSHYLFAPTFPARPREVSTCIEKYKNYLGLMRCRVV